MKINKKLVKKILRWALVIFVVEFIALFIYYWWFLNYVPVFTK